MSQILFLQGPLGPFFKLLSSYFSAKGHATHKINFNGGDRFYAGAEHITDYYGTPDKWQAFLTQYIDEHKIDKVVVYGDCRFYHKVARQVAQESNVEFWSFEEGYLRAGFVTLERGGCNANSPLFNQLDNLSDEIDVAESVSSHKVTPTFARRAWFSFCYYSWLTILRPRFKNYFHHRPWLFRQETYFWIKSIIEKWSAKLTDPPRYKRFISQFDKQFFLLPLQVEVDFQLREHSEFDSVKQVIEHVLRSFSMHASKEAALLIKHHPQNRGFEHYGALINALVTELGLEGRVLYGHDFNLPDVYHHAKGVVTVNSTVGISSLLHSLPTKVLGKALYDIEGLTYQNHLDSFWLRPAEVDERLFAKFRAYLCAESQVAGDFYKDSKLLVERAELKIMAR
ncbi:capsule biosynthesis protein [Shewanella sp. UCD-KL12]|uniref:capsule biosynthesis protein n=1 Tax=Shewanella sp. UCD-KL12 TaxID=1917163 RepID=UPI0009713408|nr:capsular biosynthesis protein [Shewanella sp. UCD-KL12]